MHGGLGCHTGSEGIDRSRKLVCQRQSDREGRVTSANLLQFGGMRKAFPRLSKPTKSNASLCELPAIKTELSSGLRNPVSLDYE